MRRDSLSNSSNRMNSDRVEINSLILQALSLNPGRSSSITPKVRQNNSPQKQKKIDLSYNEDSFQKPSDSVHYSEQSKQSILKQLKIVEQDNKRLQRELLISKEENKNLLKQNSELRYQNNSQQLSIQKLSLEIEKINRSRNLLGTRMPILTEGTAYPQQSLLSRSGSKPKELTSVLTPQQKQITSEFIEELGNLSVVIKSRTSKLKRHSKKYLI
ncbi:unnamed protein product [Blepharisma stoltei]|uniref:Uncharacterized protein n=1 Tax=Blepharisma stoltei TaxID=1481888 RepID=A0AAU9JTI5_9CILI|nr:unnamed protein product [Blepharisma stoltei]